MQLRSRETRRRIVDGVVRVLVRRGLPGVTHRAVAEAAGVSLAATTRHFATKQDMLTEVSEDILAAYLSRLERLLDRVRSGEARKIAGIDDVLVRAVRNGLLHERDRSLVWCELMLHCGRSPEGRSLARRWFGEIDRIWGALATELQGETANDAPAAVDVTLGLLFLLHPLRMTDASLLSLLRREKAVADLICEQTLQLGPASSRRAGDGLGRVTNAAIEVLVGSGPQALTYRAVSELAGLSRSAPSYYFASVERMLEAAQMALFERAKSRYRQAFRACEEPLVDVARLGDLTVAIFFSEAMEHADENLAFYSVWIRAAEHEGLRPAILSALLDQQRAWTLVLERAGLSGTNPLSMQALFVGKLVRAIAAGADTPEMARFRAQFLAEVTRR